MRENTDFLAMKLQVAGTISPQNHRDFTSVSARVMGVFPALVEESKQVTWVEVLLVLGVKAIKSRGHSLTKVRPVSLQLVVN